MAYEANLVTHDGVTMTLRQWSERIEVPYPTLALRHRKGERGEVLLRPLSVGRQNKFKPGKNVDLHRMKIDRESHLDVQRQKDEERQKKRKDREAIAKAKRAEHAAAIAAPLISHSLLSKTEREQNAERVSHSGQRGWGVKGVSL